MPWKKGRGDAAAPTMMLAAALACAALGHVPAASAQADDSDLLAPLVDPDADLIAPLTDPDADLVAPLADPDADLLAPLVDPDADLLAPLVPQNAFEEDLLAPLVAPVAKHVAKELSEEELIEKGAATIRDPNTARDALAHSLQWADREMAKTLKKIPKEDMKRAMDAIGKMDGMSDMRTPQPRPGKKPLPLEIDVAEQMEWQRKQEASNGTMVLVEKPMEVTQCTDGVCSTKLKMHYELQPVQGTAPKN
ncbi:hypothetical protein MZO42_08715 [Sphingomonas psychrotolerans]|uniref:Secreted protein n=1 Tax=Sphingomonas psychrotolerans TaxID=1327635 RepID=A0ABU3N2J8_9SPHN|nr:hypothetical protein [Sphingomonas psychrotolerans]MDT8758779.1 hypothetical protein [Sphingomonas psychrotolerans]